MDQYTVDTGYGAVQGTRRDGIGRFLGVPYAAAPVGPRRMLPPQPAAAWPGVWDATRYGPTCPKPPYRGPLAQLFDEPDIPGDECLNLNVWTPDPSARLPVFVWIHGGAFVHGSGAVPQYDGTAFARDGVVCVTVNYRLGAEGFLETGDEHTNIGILDQVAALRWVADNIGAFGGDPGRVTVGGESAGAMSVATLLASPMARGLVHGAVMQSGAGHHAMSRQTARRVAEELAGRLGVEPTRDAFARVPVDLLLDAQESVVADIQANPDFVRWAEVAANLLPFGPVVDGSVVPAVPVQAINEGASARVPVLIGTNSDEYLLFTVPTGAADRVDPTALRTAIGGYGFDDVDDVIATYSSGGEPAPGRVMAAVATDWYFRLPAIRLLEARAGAPAGSWMYEFAWESTARDGTLGACHFLEVPFVFDTLDTPGAVKVT
ncbi:MAG TPA: carboxylesterase family protein, partial [Acidimicrobiales bacterium]|nr:carboxylesterase family protein [Acidimicrobiales bacterium]